MHNVISDEKILKVYDLSLDDRAHLPASKAIKVMVEGLGGNKLINVINKDDIKIETHIFHGNNDIFVGKWINETVAIKQYKKVCKQNNILNELTILASVESNYFVELLGVVLEISPWLVMKYMPRGSLLHLLRKAKKAKIDPPPWAVRCQIALDITMGLCYLHEHNVLYGDLKSYNVLLDINNRAKLADFASSLLNTGTIKNKELRMPDAYRPPEGFDENAIMTAAVDIYALGMVFWELITLRKPFMHQDSEWWESPESLSKVAPRVFGPEWPENPTFGSEIPKDTPKELLSIMMDCLAKKPSERPRAAVVAERLNKLLQTESQTTHELKLILEPKSVPHLLPEELINLSAKEFLIYAENGQIVFHFPKGDREKFLQEIGVWRFSEFYRNWIALGNNFKILKGNRELEMPAMSKANPECFSIPYFIDEDYEIGVSFGANHTQKDKAISEKRCNEFLSALAFTPDPPTPLDVKAGIRRYAKGFIFRDNRRPDCLFINPCTRIFSDASAYFRVINGEIQEQQGRVPNQSTANDAIIPFLKREEVVIQLNKRVFFDKWKNKVWVTIKNYNDIYDSVKKSIDSELTDIQKESQYLEENMAIGLRPTFDEDGNDSLECDKVELKNAYNPGDKLIKTAEIMAIASSASDYIVELQGIVLGTDNLLVREYVKWNLAEFLQTNRKMPVRRLLYIALQITIGLHHLHQQNILHGNLNLSNVLLNDESQVKLLLNFKSASLNLLGKSSLKIESFECMAPELLPDGATATQAADIYSLGSIFSTLITNTSSPDNEEIPEAFKEITRACRHKKPDKRPTAAVVGKKLNRLEQIASMEKDVFYRSIWHEVVSKIHVTNSEDYRRLLVSDKIIKKFIQLGYETSKAEFIFNQALKLLKENVVVTWTFNARHFKTQSLRTLKDLNYLETKRNNDQDKELDLYRYLPCESSCSLRENALVPLHGILTLLDGKNTPRANPVYGRSFATFPPNDQMLFLPMGSRTSIPKLCTLQTIELLLLQINAVWLNCIAYWVLKGQFPEQYNPARNYIKVFIPGHLSLAKLELLYIHPSERKITKEELKILNQGIKNFVYSYRNPYPQLSETFMKVVEQDDQKKSELLLKKYPTLAVLTNDSHYCSAANLLAAAKETNIEMMQLLCKNFELRVADAKSALVLSQNLIIQQLINQNLIRRFEKLYTKKFKSSIWKNSNSVMRLKLAGGEIKSFSEIEQHTGSRTATVLAQMK